MTPLVEPGSSEAAARPADTHLADIPHAPSFGLATLTVAAALGIIAIGLVAGLADLHVLLAITLTVVFLSATLGAQQSPRQVLRALGRGIWEAHSALYIFVLIGALIAALMASGTVATLVAAGLSFINPAWFLPTAFLLCCLMSIATGTAWGTAGTAGVVLMGIGSTMHVPLALLAGVIVSGACFGDKMSPISDTTNLAAMSARTSLYGHIYSMAKTTVPTVFIVLAAYTLVGHFALPHPPAATDVSDYTAAIHSAYHVGWVPLIPLVVLVGLSLARVDARWCMLVTIGVAVAVAITHQHLSPTAALSALWQPAPVNTGIDILDGLFSRGGVLSMWWTLLLGLEALALGGMLTHCGYVRVVIAGLLRRIRSAAALVSSTIGGALLCNLGMGEAYMSIILGGQLFGEKYDEMGVDRTILSRSLEEGATLTTPLIPWTTAGIFFSSMLGVSTVSLLPYAWLNLLNPLIGIAFAYAGWAGVQRRVRQSPRVARSAAAA